MPKQGFDRNCEIRASSMDDLTLEKRFVWIFRIFCKILRFWLFNFRSGISFDKSDRSRDFYRITRCLFYL